MTIIGYSLNDTIVIFDRVREIRGRNPLLTPQMVNDSVNQTLSRTILTATTVFIVVAILYFVGGEGIHGYKEQYEKGGKKADWFTTNGDVFAVRVKLNHFEPRSPNGTRSFPRKNTTRGFGEWNHYYIRAINGELRLWVNGEEVSGGTGADPARGYLCLESEGSPIYFRTLRIRELP